MHAVRVTVVLLVVLVLLALGVQWSLDNQSAFNRRTTDSICRVSDRC